VLNKLDITNRRMMTLSLSMLENESGYQIADIEGLDPVKATLVSTSYAQQNGEQYQSSTRGVRDVKIKFELQPDGVETFTTLRENLFVYLMTQQEVRLRFYKESGLFVDLVGVVETHSSPSFKEDPDVTVGIRCFQPDFLDPRVVIREGNSVDGVINTAITYPGNLEASTILRMYINRELEDFSVYNTPEDGILRQLDFSGELIAGDELIISSVRGNKGITLKRASVTSSYLWGRTPQSAWIELFEGINQFRVYASGDPIPYELEYVVRYGAI
jgi:hypothetical protein